MGARPSDETTTLPKPPRVGLVSLGCPKALVDSERIMTKLRADGYDMSPDYAGADVVLVNTCGFLDSAKEESLEAIGEAIAENGRVVVTGCMGKEAESSARASRTCSRSPAPQQYEEVVAAVHEAAPPVALAVHRPGARSRPQADSAPLQLFEDFRGLQPPLRLLHHPARCAATSSAAAPTRSCAKPRSWSPPGPGNCWSSARTRAPTASTSATQAWPWKGGEVRAHMTDLARELGQRSGQPGCASTTSIPTRTSTASSR